MKKLFFCVLYALLLCVITSETLTLGVTEQQSGDAEVGYGGDKENNPNNFNVSGSGAEITFKAEYSSSPVLESYHTSAWIATAQPSGNFDALNVFPHVYLSVKAAEAHKYNPDYEAGISYDTYKFTLEQTMDMLNTLFPGESALDLTKPHTVYLSDVFIKKTRASLSDGWAYHWGKEYSSLDEFLTMYPDRYSGEYGQKKREEMKAYYNIPMTIALPEAKVIVNYEDESGKKIMKSKTIQTAKYMDCDIECPETVKGSDGKEYCFKEYKTDAAVIEEKAGGITIKQLPSDMEVTLVYKLAAAEAVTVTVKYVNASGNPIKNTQVITGKVIGDACSASCPGTVKVGSKSYKYSSHSAQNGHKVTKSGSALSIAKLKGDEVITVVYVQDQGTDEGEDAEETFYPSDSMTGSATGPVSRLLIKADTRGAELFDVASGIPSAEALYANAFTNAWLLDYSFAEYSGTKVYPVTISRNYTYINKVPYQKKNLDGTYMFDEETGEPVMGERDEYSYETVTHTYNIVREYSYWEVEGFNVFQPTQVIAKNQAMESASITLHALGLSLPSVSLSAASTHIVEPDYTKNVTLSPVTLRNTYSPGNTDWSAIAESKVGQIKCYNDSLSFDGVTYMKAGPFIKEGQTPSAPPVVGTEVNQYVFYKAGILIPYNKENLVYQSTGTVKYETAYNYGMVGNNLAKTYDINSTNSVTVHTPTVCEPTIAGASSYDQSVLPSSKTTLVLDQYFTVGLPSTGTHLNIKNYGTRDYRRYILDRQVQFPFDVYTAGNSYVAAGTWVNLESASFYLPVWVREGDYTIHFRSVALNGASKLSHTQVRANTSRGNYVATATIDVRVVGRLYGFQIYDITDYPNWRDVFRQQNSLALTGTTYTAGLRNRNGVTVRSNATYTLPIMPGSHPVQKKLSVGTGYAFRYYLYTIGSFADSNDFIGINPTFYYVSKDGKSVQNVDVYYDQTINGKPQKLVKVGSELDKSNVKTISLGDSYMSIPDEELAATAKYTGTTVNEIKNKVVKAYTTDYIKLTSELRTLVGSTANIPAGVGTTRAGSSVQKWYGTYYLPSIVRCVPVGFDVAQYALENGGITYKEDFWIGNDGGYLVVNFDITAYDGGVAALKYNSSRCNMWTMEGYKYTKSDADGNSFKLDAGDIFFYDMSRSAAEDYRPGGTH